MDDWVKKHISVYSTLILSLCYCHFISSRFPIGFFRLISLLPIFYLFTILPLFLPSVFFTAVLAFFITWLANFKLILFAFGQGPLSSDQSSKSLHIFITSAALPIRTKLKNYPSSQLQSKSTKKIPIINNLGTEILASAILIAVLVDYKDKLHPRILLLAYCCLVFLLVDCLVASSSFLVRALVGLELEPPSDEPYLSTSLQEFWGKRWNLTVTNTLRQTVYKPVRSASAAVLGGELAPLPAVLAAFLVSGLMHELLFYYVTRAKPSWEMTSFFVLHGICVVLEFGMKKALNGRLNLPWFVSGPLTVGFVVVTSFWLFFPPLIRNGADAVVFEEFRCFGERVRNWMMTRVDGNVGFRQ
ncbi:OLC1v1009449C1 [Oldenlandia corymbosa var. corymbosa]|uniref:OLC1v1009449C1 n=1 Tax=Oldenlandia corymbosa var. corymbosa TaxID=529605 RepID=A0AAV1DP21_OLDCO|nr:OLC1v1009449C1 [Oldenlandia corymbosa var. corymbosa]